MLDRLSLNQMKLAKIRRLVSLTIISIIGIGGYVLGVMLAVPEPFLTIGVLTLSVLTYVIVFFFGDFFYSGISVIGRVNPGGKEPNLMYHLDSRLEESLRQSYPLLTETQLFEYLSTLQLEIARHIINGESLVFVKDSPEGYTILQPYAFIVNNYEQRTAD